MLSSIIRAPKEMLKHAPLYGILVALTGIHGVLYLLNADIFSAFAEGNALSIIYSADTLLQARALLLILSSLVFSIYSIGMVSRATRLSTKPKNSLFFSSIAFSLVLISVVLGLFVVMRAVNGTDFQYHSQDATTQAAIKSQPWTHVVLQNYSTQPTHVGSVANHYTYGSLL